MKHITKSAIALGIALVMLPALAYAETASSTKPVRPLLKQEVRTGIKADVSASSTIPLPPKDRSHPGFLPINAKLMLTASSTVKASSTRSQFLQQVKDDRARLDERKAELKADLEVRKAKLEENKANRKQNFDQRREENIKKLAGLMFNRFDAAIKRLETLADRIDSRLTKMATAGIDVTSYRALLGDARAKIDLAIQANANAQISVQEIPVSDTPKDTFKDCQALSKEVVAALKAAHQALVDIISAIKTDHPNTGGTATTTTSTTATTTIQ